MNRSLLNPDNLLTAFLSQYKSDFPKDQVYETIIKLIDQLSFFEDLSIVDNKAIDNGSLKIGGLRGIWVLSGPGFFDQATKKDGYENFSWARFMGRDRLRYAEEIIILHNDQKPWLIFNGRQDENKNLKKTVLHGNLTISPERLHVVDNPRIRKTIDQVSYFNLPNSNEWKRGDVLGVVTHSPHMIRFLHLLGVDKKIIPEGVIVRPFPITSPKGCIPEYWNMEILGLLYRIYITRQASSEIYPYRILS